MTIDEAIKRVQNELPLVEKRGELRLYAALELAIEALKRIKEGREMNYDYFSHWLPGETK
jgi:hypothetical protein